MNQIGPYKIENELGRGAMGIVYRAVDPVIGRTVAIKTVHTAELGGDPTEQDRLKERLFREAKSAGILSHPGIVTIYQAGQDNDVLFIAMEFIDGPNLAVALSRTRPSVELTLQLLKQAAEALDYAHSKGVIHRDIKPANLLLQSEGRLKIADFGIAKLAASNLTKTGTTVGSPAYMSPEQIRALAMDGRADQYSLAIMAYEMLTGVRPFDSDTITSLVFKIVFEPPDLGALTSVPGGNLMEPVLQKALSKSADDRYPNCVAFWKALSDAVAAQGSAGATEPAVTIQSTIPMPSTALMPPPRPPVSPAGLTSTPALPVQARSTPSSIQSTATAAPSSIQSTATAAPSSIHTTAQPSSAQVNPEPSRRGLIAGLGGGIVALAGGGFWWMSSRSAQTVQPVPTEPKEPQKPLVEPPSKGKTPESGAAAKPANSRAVLISRIEAPYTPQRKGAEGTVKLKIIINEQGMVEEPEIAQSVDPGLDRSALDTVRKWRFKPAVMNGAPVASKSQVEFSFVIPR